MDRTCLYVPFEENDEVEALGAHWDDDSKYWYIGAEQDARQFQKWLPPDPSRSSAELEYSIVSDHASIAAADIACRSCHSNIEVICIFCGQGMIDGEKFIDFSVSNITAIDHALARQLQRWPYFRSGSSGEPGGEYFANYCPHCSMRQEEYFLHCEPAGAFFRVKESDSGALRFTPLTGTVRLNGSEAIEF